MKLLTLIMAVAASAAAQTPGQFQLAWDASPSPGVAGYRLYGHTNTLAPTNLSSAVLKLDTGTNRVATVAGAAPATWHFWATAVSTNGIESGPSNELVAQVPAPSPNLRTLVVQWNATVSGTNWVNAGFIRVKFGDP